MNPPSPNLKSSSWGSPYSSFIFCCNSLLNYVLESRASIISSFSFFSDFCSSYSSGGNDEFILFSLASSFIYSILSIISSLWSSGMLPSFSSSFPSALSFGSEIIFSSSYFSGSSGLIFFSSSSFYWSSAIDSAISDLSLSAISYFLLNFDLLSSIDSLE